MTVTAPELTAGQYVREVAAPGVSLLVRQRGQLFGAGAANVAIPSMPHQSSVKLLIAEADAALYEAKHRGKNRTVRAPVREARVFTPD